MPEYRIVEQLPSDTEAFDHYLRRGITTNITAIAALVRQTGAYSWR